MRKKLLQPLAVGFWLVLWQIAALIISQEIFLVTPVRVAVRLSELMFTSVFWQSILFSFSRIILGFFLALVLGLALAVCAALFPVLATFLEPPIRVTKSVPVASFIVLTLMWIPSRNLSIFISFVMVLPVVYTNILQGIVQTDKKLLEMAKVFGIGFRRKILYIYLSQILPFLLSAVSLALGLCWKAGIAAEVIGMPTGSIGERLQRARVLFLAPDLFAWTVVIILISFLFERFFLSLLKRLVTHVERS